MSPCSRSGDDCCGRHVCLPSLCACGVSRKSRAAVVIGELTEEIVGINLMVPIDSSF